jgi:hypothetical protein
LNATPIDFARGTGRHCAVTIYDPRRPDILLWLSAMEPNKAACIMTAMKQAFPVLREHLAWAQAIAERSSGMTKSQRQTMAKRADKIAKRILREMSKELAYPPYLR